MDATKQFIRRSFQCYRNMKKDEFLLRGNARADAILMKKGYAKNKLKRVKLLYTNIPEGVGVSIADKSFIDKLSPNNIDSRYFWRKAIEVFPFASICYSPGKTTLKEFNKRALEFHISSTSLSQLENVLKTKKHPQILEIGPGYGCVKNFIRDNYSLKNYYAIDVNPLFRFKRLYQTDGKTIPECIPDNLDVVYSVNVFQHLSPEQRMSYYKQIREKLVPGGKFIFSMFVVDNYHENMVFGEEIEGKKIYYRLFGTRDEEGNSYINFFSQLTKCDRIEEVKVIFETLNMDFEVFWNHYNGYHMIATKK